MGCSQSGGGVARQQNQLIVHSFYAAASLSIYFELGPPEPVSEVEELFALPPLPAVVVYIFSHVLKGMTGSPATGRKKLGRGILAIVKIYKISSSLKLSKHVEVSSSSPICYVVME